MELSKIMFTEVEKRCLVKQALLEEEIWSKVPTEWIQEAYNHATETVRRLSLDQINEVIVTVFRNRAVHGGNKDIRTTEVVRMVAKE